MYHVGYIFVCLEQHAPAGIKNLPVLVDVKLFDEQTPLVQAWKMKK